MDNTKNIKKNKKSEKNEKNQKNEISYYSLTKTGFYSFTSSLPLLIIYQIMAFYLTRSFLNAHRSVAETWLVGLFSLLGTIGFVLLGFIGAGLIVYFYLLKKKYNIPVVKYFYLLMLIESIVYSFFFGAIVMRILKLIQPLSVLNLGLPYSKWQSIMLSLGAGYFEELIFRVILYGGILYSVIFTAEKLKPKNQLKIFKIISMIIIGLLTSIIFSLAHHITGEPFTNYAFIFRTISGIIFVILYQLRGFGIAAYTHAFYDLWIVIEAI